MVPSSPALLNQAIGDPLRFISYALPANYLRAALNYEGADRERFQCASLAYALRDLVEVVGAKAESLGVEFDDQDLRDLLKTSESHTRCEGYLEFQSIEGL